MPVDASIYKNMGVPDIMGSVEKGMRLRDMLDDRRQKLDEREKKKAIEGAYKAGVVQNPDGTTSFNQDKTFGELLKASPEQGLAFQKQMQADRATKAKQDYEGLQISANLLGGVSDQPSWSVAREKAISLGLAAPNELPEAYDENLVRTYQGMALSALQRIGQQNKDRDFGFRQSEAERDQRNKDRDLGIKERELQAKKSGAIGQKLTKAQETVDSEFGKEYSQWTSGGSDAAKTELQKLRGVAQRLRDHKVTTGGLTGAFPDRMTADSVLSARADVQSTVMNSLRAILGAQFTEKEGDRIIKNTWNEADTTENNLARVERLIQNLEAQAVAKDAKAQYYEQAGTLSGFRAGDYASRGGGRGNTAQVPGGRGSSGSWGIDKANASSPQVFKTKDIDWAD